MYKRCLIIDDDPDYRLILREILNSSLSKNWTVEARPAPFLDIHDYFSYDLLILDERIGHFRGSEIISILRRVGYSGGLVLVSGDKRVGGAFDAFVWKDEIDNRLPEVLLEYLEQEQGYTKDD